MDARAKGCVLVSLAAYEPASWIDALVQNTLAFTESSTFLVMHLSNATEYGEDVMDRWNATAGRTAINGQRLPTRSGYGSVLYAHMLNARFATHRWAMPSSCCCSFVVLMASTMLWVRPGMEARVRTMQSSVGREGWARQGMPGASRRMWRYHQNHAKSHFGDPHERITSDFYFNLTSGGGRHAWSYHEGSFYPLGAVLRFLALLEDSLPRADIMAATLFPEEWWLQAYVLNSMNETVRTHNTSQQLSTRYVPTSQRVPARVVEAAARELELECQKPSAEDHSSRHRYYAHKSFAPNRSEPLTARALQLQPCQPRVEWQ